VSELWHVSEDPAIEVFEPQRNELHALDEPLVWAVDAHYWWLYWFPRDCPRACFEANADTTDEDVEHWLDGDRKRRVAVVESGWLERFRSARVYAYRLPPDSFEPWDKFARHADAGNELRIAPTLYPLWDRIVETTLDFSGIRLRNASRR
jgi:uncharacterized protein DUF6886